MIPLYLTQAGTILLFCPLCEGHRIYYLWIGDRPVLFCDSCYSTFDPLWYLAWLESRDGNPE
jgi:hypothetical protein